MKNRIQEKWREKTWNRKKRRNEKKGKCNTRTYKGGCTNEKLNKKINEQNTRKMKRKDKLKRQKRGYEREGKRTKSFKN